MGFGYGTAILAKKTISSASASLPCDGRVLPLSRPVEKAGTAELATRCALVSTAHGGPFAPWCVQTFRPIQHQTLKILGKAFEARDKTQLLPHRHISLESSSLDDSLYGNLLFWVMFDPMAHSQCLDLPLFYLACLVIKIS